MPTAEADRKKNGGKMKKLLLILGCLLFIGGLVFAGGEKEAQKVETGAIEETSEQVSPETIEQKASEEIDSHYPVTIEVYNNDRELIPYTFYKAPEKTLVYGRNNVEILLALGLADHIYMIADASFVKEQWMEEFSKIKQVRDTQEVGYFVREYALSLEPDMVIGWYSLFNLKDRMGAPEFWHERNIGTYTTISSVIKTNQTLENTEYADMRNIAKIYNVEERAEALIDEIEAAVAKGVEAAKGQTPPRVLILEKWKGKYDIFPPESVAGDIVRRLGAEPIGHEGMGDEDIVVANPDVIFAVHVSSWEPEDAIELYTGNPALQSVEAVKNGRLYPVTYHYAYAPGVRTIDSVNLFLDYLYGIKE